MIVKKTFNDNKKQTYVKPLKSEALKRELSQYSDYVQDFNEGVIPTEISTLSTTVTVEKIKTYLSNPEKNIDELSNLMMYYFISNGDIYQLYTIFRSLPSLNYKIKAFDNTYQKYEAHLSEINKYIVLSKYKELARDLISQASLDGGVVAMWCGQKKNPYLYIFEDMRYVFPRYRKNGDWSCVFDLAYLDEMQSEEERLNMLANLSPYITEGMYNQYKDNTQDKEKRYIELPIERTSYIRGSDYLRRNQRIATPLGTQALLDINHKETLKNLEKSISNRVIKNIGILTIGSDEKDKSYLDIDPTTRRKLVAGVGKALKQNASTDTSQIPLATLPEFMKLDFQKVDGLDALKPEKFETITSDIAKDTGAGSGIITGDGSNYAGAKINLQMLYKRISIILEQIDDVFNKLIKIILPKSVANNFYFEFDKQEEISVEKQMDILMQLTSQGYSAKPVVDLMTNVTWDDYIETSRYDIEKLKLREWLMPPLSSYTQSSDSSSSDSDANNENTQKSNQNGSNETPKAEV